MRCRYIIFTLTVLLFHILNWYFVICFCSTYVYSNKSWLKGAFIGLIIDYLGIKLGIPLVKALLREILKCWCNIVLKKIYSFWVVVMTIMRPKRIVK